MPLYSIRNASRHSQMIVAANPQRALELAMKSRHIKNLSKAKPIDITESYTKAHTHRGFNLAKLSEGIFYQEIKHNKSAWHTYMP